MTAPLKIGLYVAGLVALFFASFLAAQLLAPAGAGAPAEQPTMTHSAGIGQPAASGRAS
ncbi:hypothetical protein [Microterricola pindariensis]|uniref:hypothetical protein n=1 Tax=Microterricola pindariensis TaxID=478010 RepID=UPI001374C2C7|nr:hypothetical protein [Microterricola pindariensis]